MKGVHLATKVTGQVLLLVAALLLAGCSSPDNPDATQAAPEAPLESEDEEADEAKPELSELGDEPEAAESESGATSEASGESASGNQTAGAAVTEDEIVDALTASDLPITNLEVFDAETDPNSLLGRPGQYTVKISWEDGRLADSIDPGGTLELFPDAESMPRRADYVEEIGREVPMLLQWVFTDERTGVVLRVLRDLTPDQAAEYGSWLQSLP